MSMSGIVLSASVRQNLLSLQSTASLLATTQNDLATGNKVNSALDNPTNFFTAAGLNNRASDIGNLLDSIGNGVQVLQAANTGITSLQSLVSSAQSIANQVLQTPVGYSTKSNFTSTAITGATANNLLGSVGAATNASAAATTALTTITSTNTTPASSGTITAGAFTALNVSGTASGPTAAATVTGTGFATVDLSGSNTASFTLNVDGTSKSITLNTAAVAAFTTAGGTISGTNATLTATDISKIVDYQFNNSDTTGTGPVTVSGGQLSIASSTTGTGSIVQITGLTQTGVTTGLSNDPTNTGAASVAAASESFTLTVDGGAAKTITLDAAHVTAFTTAGGTLAGSASALTAADVANITNYQFNGNSLTGATPATVAGGALVFASATTGTGSSVATSAVTTAGTASGSTGITALTHTGAAAISGTALTFKVNTQTVTLAAGQSYTAAQVASAINGQVTGVSASVTGGKLTIASTGTPGATDAVTVGTFSTGDATQLGFATAAVSVNGTAATGGLSGETLTVGATGGGAATTITFGTGANQVSTLNQLNTALAANNLQATIDSSTGQINIVTSNDAAASTIGAIGGTATASGSAFSGATTAAPVVDPNSQATRASLVSQYNNVLQQINTTASDSSFNGVNLLNGDTLKLVFNETGTSTLSITGVTFNGAGLGLSTLAAGTSFLDNSSANNVLTQLQNASTTLRGEASALGSNLSIVEIRQDFNKNLINVLQTGASNLTLADPNQEAANSQALSTRQSIAVSALALANQSQQSVLQLLR
jgi:flagellin-like hook-associated protein FlgL